MPISGYVWVPLATFRLGLGGVMLVLIVLRAMA